MTAQQLKEWQLRNHFTLDTAAETLGMHRATFARYLKHEGQLPNWLVLACKAVDLGVVV